MLGEGGGGEKVGGERLDQVQLGVYMPALSSDATLALSLSS